MPQLNFYTYLSQVSWTILIFVSFFAIMKIYLLPAILESLKLKKYVLKIAMNPIITSNFKTKELEEYKNIEVNIKDKYFTLLQK